MFPSLLQEESVSVKIGTQWLAFLSCVCHGGHVLGSLGSPVLDLGSRDPPSVAGRRRKSHGTSVCLGFLVKRLGDVGDYFSGWPPRMN